MDLSGDEPRSGERIRFEYLLSPLPGLANGGRFSPRLAPWAAFAALQLFCSIPGFDREKGLAMSGGGGQYCVYLTRFILWLM
jgi:hypothetical protein